jgi:hypothetical protein
MRKDCVNQCIHVGAVPWACDAHVRRKAGKGLPGLPKNKSWLELPEMIEMLERRRKYRQYKSQRLLDKSLILLR